MYGERRGAYRIFVGRPEGKRSLGIPWLRWEDNIVLGLKKLRWGSMDRIYLAQNRDRYRALVNAVMNLSVQKIRRIS